MYASVGVIQIEPGQIATFTDAWATQIEPVMNQIAPLIDLYVLVNAELHTVMIVYIYGDEATALACESSPTYQQLFARFTRLVNFEVLTKTGYSIIST